MKFFDKWLRGVGLMMGLFFIAVSSMAGIMIFSWLVIKFLHYTIDVKPTDELIYSTAIFIFIVFFPYVLPDLLKDSMDALKDKSSEQ